MQYGIFSDDFVLVGVNCYGEFIVLLRSNFIIGMKEIVDMCAGVLKDKICNMFGVDDFERLWNRKRNELLSL